MAISNQSARGKLSRYGAVYRCWRDNEEMGNRCAGGWGEPGDGKGRDTGVTVAVAGF